MIKKNKRDSGIFIEKKLKKNYFPSNTLNIKKINNDKKKFWDFYWEKVEEKLFLQ